MQLLSAYYYKCLHKNKSMFLKNLFSNIFKGQNKFEYTTGQALPSEELYLSDLEKYPIWIYAVDEEGVEGQDETWLKPITNSTNVEKDLGMVYILLKIKENNCPVCGLLHPDKMKLDDLQFWDSEYEDWEDLNKLDLPSPIHLVSVPSILGKSAVEFKIEISQIATPQRIIAKILTQLDENKSMHKILSPNTCPVCHAPLSHEINPNFIASRRQTPIRSTYDGYCIVTEKFKQFCTENNYPNLVFKELPKSPGYYCFSPQDVFPLDPIRREVEIFPPCPSCGEYEGVYGATPAYKAEYFSLPSNDFIYRSDLEFGDKGKRSPLIIIGLETEIKMKKYGLKSIYFDDVYE